MSGSKTELDAYEELQKKAKELRDEEESTIAAIRSGFKETVIVFMDVVGSTAYKTEHKANPEKWILRIRQFSLLLATAISKAGGRVVKYIGDEVMGVFDNVFDAQNLLGRVDDLQTSLTEATGVRTEIKVAVDVGEVYLLKFEGHQEPDPMGPCVDRCARIGKYGAPGQVLSSSSFATRTPKLAWKSIGQIDLKGIGPETIWQLGEPTIDLVARIEVSKSDYDRLRNNLDESLVEISRLAEMNKLLKEQLLAAGAKPDASLSTWSDEPSKTLRERIVALKEVIASAPGPRNEYAAFVFRYHTKKPGLRPDPSRERNYENLITSSLVESAAQDGVYELNLGRKKNKDAIEAVRALELALSDYLRHHQEPSSDHFEWKLDDPEFWSKKLGFDVL